MLSSSQVAINDIGLNNKYANATTKSEAGSQHVWSSARMGKWDFSPEEPTKLFRVAPKAKLYKYNALQKDRRALGSSHTSATAVVACISASHDCQKLLVLHIKEKDSKNKQWSLCDQGETPFCPQSDR